MHVLPQLRRLEQRFGSELVVIGVHSGKFWAERNTENIRQAVLRLEVEHPVINDRQFRIWRAYGIRAWPTIVMINPDGRQVDAYPGEFTAEEVAPVIEQQIQRFEGLRRLDRTPLAFQTEAAKVAGQHLAFPTKILALPEDRLAIADTGHHRVLILTVRAGEAEGKIEAVIGGDEAGLQDGDFRSARFNRPQGLAFDRARDVLYVADTENHSIRAIDLAQKQVATIAGTGEQARTLTRGGNGRQVALSSPWDLVMVEGIVYIAMAGTHQLWRVDPATFDTRPYAGTRFEELTDGTLERAALAQPSGITTDGKSLYFADSESSAIRRASLDPDGWVRTIVGKGLFDFGDTDGIGEVARLQHPQGVVWQDGALYVADTYNNKIKRIDPATRQSSSFLGTGEAGMRDGDQPQFDEPGGLTATNGKLYIADTNNHRIRMADIATGQVTTLKLQDI